MTDPVIVAPTTPDAAIAAVNAAATAVTTSHGRLYASIALAIGLLGILMSLRRQNKIATNGYSLVDLLLGDDGKASKAAHVMFGAFFLTSWIVGYQTLTGKLSDVMFGTYLAIWVTPAVTKLIVGVPKPPTT